VHEAVIWLLALLLVPALLALMVLMEWLEKRSQQRMVADDVLKAFWTYDSPDEIEALVGRTVEPLIREPVR
jgi:hypothetical protein